MRKLFASLLLVTVMLVEVNANITLVTDTTVSFKVNGNEACKSNIEALLNGVHGISSVVWDANTKKVTVAFNAEEIKEDMISVYFAEGGYDTEKLRAKERNYEALSEACKYLRDPERD